MGVVVGVGPEVGVGVGVGIGVGVGEPGLNQGSAPTALNAASDSGELSAYRGQVGTRAVL